MAIKSKKGKISTRQRTKYRIRKRVVGTEVRPRVTVFRSGKHISVQAVEDWSGKTLASASTLEKGVMKRISEICGQVKSGENSPVSFPNESSSSKGTRAAFAVGVVLAERLKEKSKTDVVFDRNGFLYHGRIRAVAEGARFGGLKF